VQGMKSLRKLLLVGLILCSTKAAFAQAETPNTRKALVVNGKTMEAGVRQIGGHSYVDIETLAQITNGAVTVEPDRIVLTFAPPAAAPAAPATAAAPPSPEVISRDFAAASIGTLADMREWRGAISMMITYGLAVNASWSSDYRDRVEEDLSQNAIAATTDADQNVLPLLRNEFDKLNAWANETLAARQALNGAKTIDPNALKNDPSLAKISECGRFLNSMIVSRTFSDNLSCH